MILDAAWSPTSTPVFASAGRDKQIKIWAKERQAGFALKATTSEEGPVTAVGFFDGLVGLDQAYLAIGTEVGMFKIYVLNTNQFSVTAVKLVNTISYPSPSKAITQLAWKPAQQNGKKNDLMEIAIASEDSSLRIYSLNPSVT